MSDTQEFVIENGVLKKYTGPGGAVAVPEGVTVIGYGAFAGCEALASVAVPAGVTVIEGRAFAGCRALESVTLPDGLERIGPPQMGLLDGVFWECRSLRSIAVPDSVKRLGESTFYGCRSLASVTLPEEGTWYVIQTAEDFPERADKVMNAGGWYAHSNNNGNQYSYWLDQYTTADVETNSRTSFVFRRNADGTLTMQNAGSGFFLGPETGSGNTTYDYRPIQWYEPNNVQLIPLGDGQVGFRLESGRYIRGNAAWYADGMTYEYNEGNEPMAYSAFAWQVYPVSDICSQITETQSIAQGRVIAITKPHDLESLPTTEYGTVQGYRIVGKLTEEGSSDSIITAYKLQAYEDGEIIPAGTPVIYITEGDSYNADVSYEVEFNPYIDGEVTNLPDTVNGLAGNIDSYTTDIDHLGYFLEDSVVDEPVGVLIGYNRAYIIPWLVEDLTEGNPDAVDKIVYVKGAGMLNDIKDVVIEDQKEKVDVYSIDGVLIRRNVARAGATNGLAKGIYIVGKQKVLVK